MSPVIKRAQSLPGFTMIHTDQHYAETLSGSFFRDLNLPEPKYHLQVRSGTHAQTTARAVVGIEEILMKDRPSIVLVQGDTNTVLAGGLAASKLGIRVGHIEAGLRSYDRSMPEEINRILIDHISDLLFAPTPLAGKILENEGIEADKIVITGNTIVDAVLEAIQTAKKSSSILEILHLSSKRFAVLTLHRQENVDSPERLKNILSGLQKVVEALGITIIFPMHPRTRTKLRYFHLTVPKGIRVIEPIGYFDLLVLQLHGRITLTDSGGLQEESCILGTPCVTLRDNTERPETIEIGANLLAGAKPQKILDSVLEMQTKSGWNNPFGDGKASERIIEAILNRK